MDKMKQRTLDFHALSRPGKRSRAYIPGVAEPAMKTRSAAQMAFGRDCILPAPFDPRLVECVPSEVVAAAREGG